MWSSTPEDQQFTLIHQNLNPGKVEADFVLIVEKETVFYHLIQNQFCTYFPNAVLITAKGYPDYLTLNFLKKLLHSNPKLPFFYLGDFDPFGIDILLAYMFSCPIQVFEAFGMPVITPLLGLFHHTPHASQKALPLDIEDINKIHQMLSLPFFQKIQNTSQLDFFQKEMSAKMIVLKDQLDYMLSKNCKCEVELLKEDYPNLNVFLLKEIQNIFQLALN